MAAAETFFLYQRPFRACLLGDRRHTDNTSQQVEKQKCLSRRYFSSSSARIILLSLNRSLINTPPPLLLASGA